MLTVPNRRYLSIDLLKGIGVLYLVFLHQIVWMFIQDDTGHLIFDQAYTFVYSFCHSILGLLGLQVPLLAGFTFFLNLRTKKRPWKSVSKRACTLIFLGFLLNILTWGFSETFEVEDIFAWDVLGFIGLSMMLVYPIFKQFHDKTAFCILLSVAVLALACSQLFLFQQWKDSDFCYLYYVFMGDPKGYNYWPLCPWFATFVWGAFIGKIFILQQEKYLLGLACLGGMMFTLSFLTGHLFPPTNTENIWGPNLFKPDPFFVIGILGFSSLVIPSLDVCLEHRTSLKQALEKHVFAYIGRGTLWVYMLTIILGYNLTHAIQKHVHLTYQSSLLVLFGLIIFELCIAGGVGWWEQQKNKVSSSCNRYISSFK